MGNCCSNENRDRYTSLSARTSLQLEKGYLKWTIENFKLLALSNKVVGGNMNEVAYTFNFGNEIAMPASWKFYLELEKNATDPKLGLYLKLVNYNGPQKELWIQFGFRVENRSGNHISAKFKNPHNLRNNAVGWKKIGLLSQILTRFVNSDGSLVIRLKMKQFSRSGLHFIEVQPYQQTSKSVDTQNCALALRDLSTLLESEMYSDCEINVDGKKLKAHKNIMSARSAVFQAMFQNDMKESRSGAINVQDISYPTMKLLLEFLYSGHLAKPKIGSIPELIYAADKYCVKGLIDSCEQHIMNNISIPNALELYSLAKRHGLKKAIPVIEDYISKHVQPILKQSLINI